MTAVRTSRRGLVLMRRLARRASLARRFAVGLAVAAVASGLATLAAMTAPNVTPRTVLILLYLNIFFALPLGAVIAWRLSRLWAERRRGRAGSGLHARLVVLFGLVAVTPAVLVAVFAGLFLNFGLEGWFSDRVRTALDASQVVAEAYLNEHKKSIVSEVSAMANDLNRNASALMRSPQRFTNVLSTQAALRSLPEAVIMDGEGRIIFRSRLNLSLEFDAIPPGAFAKAAAGEVVILTAEQDDRVRALLKLDRFIDTYLLVGRFVDPEVIEQTERTEGAVSQYRLLEKHRSSIQISFVLIFVVVALLLLMAAVWIGLNLATHLAGPISRLISASEKIRAGDLSARVSASLSSDEIGNLSRAFNRMAEQLESQQQGLIEANRELDERRQFTETVLTGVTAGVIGLDGEQSITLPNKSASELLEADLEAAVGTPLSRIFPEIAEMLEEARLRPGRLHQREIRLLRNRKVQTFLVRVAAERVDGETIGYVVTFDDITGLLSAQRTAAWADIARRIAHEIKNPLTPIQLSAERLRRKYSKEISSDPETFNLCTETIVRQVEDIGRMVDDFSSFARMPQPSMKPEDLVEICRQAVFLEQVRHPDVTFDIDLPDGKVPIRCDGRQVGRALVNVLKNGAESVERRLEEADGDEPGRVELRLDSEFLDGVDQPRIKITVGDNGAGLPKDQRERLVEPYVTTRGKGTGLGLAIVKKIMEDHNGDLLLEDRDPNGAKVLLVFNPALSGTEENGDSETGEDARLAESEDTATDIAVHGS